MSVNKLSISLILLAKGKIHPAWANLFAASDAMGSRVYTMRWVVIKLMLKLPRTIEILTIS